MHRIHEAQPFPDAAFLQGAFYLRGNIDNVVAAVCANGQIFCVGFHI